MTMHAHIGYNAPQVYHSDKCRDGRERFARLKHSCIGVNIETTPVVGYAGETCHTSLKLSILTTIVGACAQLGPILTPTIKLARGPQSLMGS